MWLIVQVNAQKWFWPVRLQYFLNTNVLKKDFSSYKKFLQYLLLNGIWSFFSYYMRVILYDTFSCKQITDISEIWLAEKYELLPSVFISNY